MAPGPYAPEARPDYPGRLRLDGRGYVVLGTGDGIGGAVCDAIAQAGGRVLCVDLDGERVGKTAARCGGEAMTADVTDREQLTAVFDRAEELFGESFHGIVDVVGVSLAEPLADGTEESMRRQFDLVLRHPVLLTQVAIPRLAALGHGSVVFIGSLAGTANTPRLGLYGTAKAAVHHLATACAQEFGPYGVRTNAVVVGRILGSGGTPNPPAEAVRAVEAVVPQRRCGFPDDIASVVLFLLSDLAGYVNGAEIPVDGGIGVVSPLPSTHPANR
ncbi:SDR family NAD(P)-dependent oxidoreductase [Streptosporangium sp. CA-115845]|uniref:SDR family NAD(P)-dependent oxidoreductase n=1 Tax=Streptosporangium sp. CA-115845 TaxID=3240071 RepID=UPI003D8F30BE